MNKIGPILIIVFVLGLLARSSFFIVPEGKQALVFQFGKIQGDAKTESGLHFKIPFIQNVEFFEKRILNWDGSPEEVPTGDKMYVIVDTTARLKITDVILFRRNLENVSRASAKIESIIDSATKNIISSNNFAESVRSSNEIIKQLEEKKKLQKENIAAGNLELIEEEVIGEVQKIKIGREKLSRKILNNAKGQLKQFGIDLIDVQLRRIAYKSTVERAVHERMKSERQRIAEKLRSIGKGEQAKILGKQKEELQKIESDAYKTAEKIRGQAEAKALKIYANAVGANPDFYEFLKTIETYKNGIKSNTKFVFSSDSAFLKLLKDGIKAGAVK